MPTPEPLPPLPQRLAVVVGQVATIVVTWPLWNVRDDALPLLAGLRCDLGWLLLLSCLAALRWPVPATLVHWGVLVAAILMDQTREQPQVLSLALLLLATWPRPWAARVVILHLAALWFFAGLGKLTSARFLTVGGNWLVGGEGAVDAAAGTSVIVAAAGVAIAEVLCGLGLVLPRGRRRAAFAGALLHLGILGFLSPLGRDVNPAVWPWNATLMVVAWSVPRPGERLCAQRPARGAATLFLLLPVGFHLGLVDAPLAFQVYTQNVVRGLVVRGDGQVEVPAAPPALRVGLPPVARVLAVWFRRHAGPSDRLILVDDRPLAGWFGPREVVVRPEAR
ncbi:MAG: hypothetical protein IT455_15495 [Planctomycetes bacterium]|nr:hypothetical protein [Planctomycetota bacterium]